MAAIAVGGHGRGQACKRASAIRFQLDTVASQQRYDESGRSAGSGRVDVGCVVPRVVLRERPNELVSATSAK